MTDKRAHYGALGGLLLVALTGCSSAVEAVCQTQSVGTGGYVVKFTRVSGQTITPACDVATGTPALFSDVWQFEQYGKANDGKIAFASLSVAPPDDSTPNSPVYAKGTFSAEYPDSNQICTVPTMSTLTDLGGASVLSYTATNLQFLSTAFYIGTQFKGDVAVTRNGCSANYTVQALSPTVGCDANADCDPFKKPVSSGIQSNYNQGCITDPWTADAATLINDNYVGNPAPTAGVCFLKADFPSLGSFTP